MRVRGSRILSGSIAASLAIVALVAWALWQERQDAWRNAERSAQNLVQVLSSEIRRRIQLYDFALSNVIRALEDTGLERLGPDISHRILANIVNEIDFTKSALILDATGTVVGDSAATPPRSGNFADRDYFQEQRGRPDAGLYISRPFEGRLSAPDPLFAVSRRQSEPDGSFAGVVLVAIRLAYLQDLFSKIDVGKGGVIVLTRADGTVMLRQPSSDGQGDAGRNVAATEIFKHIASTGSGSFAARAGIDGVERFYTFLRIPDTPLIITIGLSVDEILADWWHRALVIGGLALLVCGGSIGFALLLRRELRRRAAVEADLAFLSVTDGLTALANRRRFDEVIAREWRRTGRTGSSLALLLIDADRFKTLNDRYGHARGDEVLRTLARVIDASIRRPGDLAARFGGDEFAAVLPDTPPRAAMEIAERIRSQMAEKAQEGEASGEPCTTVSIGMAWAEPTEKGSATDLLETADAALYRAKDAGRNTVVQLPLVQGE